MGIDSFPKFRIYIKKEYQAKRARNPKYSMRAFARDLDFKPTVLSDILKGRYGISVSKAKQLTKKFQWTEEQSDYFCDLVEYQHGRSSTRRQTALKRLQSKGANYLTIDRSQYEVITHWQYFAILQLTLLKDYQDNANWIADQLGLRVPVVKLCLEQLKLLNLLVQNQDGRWIAAANNTVSQKHIGNSIHQFQESIFQIEAKSFTTTPKELRHFANLVVALDNSRINEFKKIITRFCLDLNENASQGNLKNEVYCFTVGLFPLSKSQ